MSMTLHERTGLAFSLAVLITLSGCASPKGGYVPPESLTTPSAQISEALSVFTVKVQSENLAKYRRTAREELMRGAIMDFFTGKNLTQAAFAQEMPAPRELLCLPRYRYLRIAAPLQNTSAKAAAIKELLSPPSQETRELFESLSKTYTIDVVGAETSSNYDIWIVNDGSPCAAAVKTANPFATHDYLGKEFSLVSALPAAKALFDSVWGIVKPAVNGALQNIDLERRNNAIREYFASPKNVALLKDDLARVEKFLMKEFELEQQRSAGVAVVAQAAAFAPESYLPAMAAAESNGCPIALRRLAANKVDPEGGSCLKKIYIALDASIKTALDAGDAFDASIERQLPKILLSTQVDALSDIAQGKIPADDKARALWGTLLRYSTLYGTVKEVAGDENKKKREEAWRVFKDAMQ
ncbi:hypothetical protein [Polaromonas sp.]|uniref:hypothetical protein n=1 Tax=Polaromonas sp. TaxID=1869339 RepID=UPI003C80FE66